MVLIEDGREGYTARVTNKNQVMVKAVSLTEMEEASMEGNVYILPSDFITLNTAGQWHGVLSIKNIGETKILHIVAGRYSSTKNVKWRIKKNPTGGTLFSSGTLVTPTNYNFKSSKLSSTQCFKGAEGLTVTGGDLYGGHTTGTYGTVAVNVSGALILETGNILTIEAMPENTATEVQMMITFFESEIL